MLLALWPALAQPKTFYLTVAGLGGEPDYEQRFDGLASEAEKSERAPGGDIEAVTLKGAQATRTAVRNALASIAQSASK